MLSMKKRELTLTIQSGRMILGQMYLKEDVIMLLMSQKRREFLIYAVVQVGHQMSYQKLRSL